LKNTADFTSSSFITHKMESHLMHTLWDIIFWSVVKHILHKENPYIASSILTVHAEIILILFLWQEFFYDISKLAGCA